MQKKKQSTFSLPTSLKKGDWVDAQQKDGNFKLAKVITIDDKEVSIRFQDFDEYRRDCKLYIDSMRLAPLRRHTVGYTGPKYLSRDANLDIARIPDVMNRLKGVNEGKEGNAYEITQFLRGKVYMLVEHILSFPANLLNKQELKDLVEFLEFYVKWSVEFGKRCIKGAEVYFEELVTNKESYLVNPRVAEIASLAEVYYCIQLILMVKGEYRNKLYKVLPEKEQRFRSLLVEYKGVEMFVKTLEFKDQAGRGFPAVIRVYSLVILNYLKAKFTIPEFDVRDHLQLPKVFSSMLELFPSEKLQNDIIGYSLKLMSGQNNFQTRLKGLNELKSNLESVKAKDPQTMEFKRISQDKFLHLLRENRFFETLLHKKTFNPEIFKRSVPLLKFLSEKKAFGANEIKHIFLLAEDRHESDKRLIYDTISEIAAFSPVDILDNLWQELLKLPLDQATIDVLQNFTIKAIRNISAQSSFFDIFRKRKSSPKYDLYAINHFWSEIQDSSKIKELTLLQFMLSSLKTMFTHTSFSYARDQYIQQSLNNLKKKHSIAQSLRILIDIIMTYNADSYLLGGDSRHQIIQKLDKKHKLLDIFFNALKTGDPGKMGYTLSIQYLFEFLQSFNESLKTSLKISEITSLWKAEYSMSPLLAFLRKPKPMKYSQKLEYQQKYYKKLSDNLIRELFDNIFLKPKLMNNYNISEEIFQTVDELFLSLHISQKNIRFKDKSLIRVTQSQKQLEGSSFFLNVVYSGGSGSGIVSKAVKRYVGLNVRVVNEDAEELVGLWRGFLERVLSNLEMEPNKANQHLPLFTQFFQSIQGLTVRANVVQRSSVSITVFHKDTQTTIDLPKHSSLFKLHQLIKQKFPSIKHFKLALVESDKIITFQQQEDFSVKSLESKSNVVKIVEVERNAFDEALFIFKNHVSKSKIYETLLSLLINPEVQQDLVWNLLEILPRSKSLMEKLNNPRESEKEWPTFFSDKVEILVYKLKLVKELVLKEEWLENFTAGNGVKYLVERIITNISKPSEKEVKCLLLLVNNLVKCIDSRFGKETLRVVDHGLMIKALGESVVGNLNSKPNKHSVPLLTSTLDLILRILKSKEELGGILAGDSGFYQELTSKGIVMAGESNVFIERLNELFKLFVPAPQQQVIVSELVGKLKEPQPRPIKFFDLLINCFNNLKDQNFLINSPELIDSIKAYCNRILSAETSLNTDQLLDGAFKLKSLLITKNLIPEEQLPLLESLISSYILPEKGSVKIHLQISLLQFYHLLVALLTKHPEYCQVIFQRLAFQLKLYEKSSIKYDWGVQLQKQPRKKFCGLRNLRATCYINSLIQQLYMIQPFREALLRQNSQTYRQTPKENEILQFQKVFTYLKQSKKSSYNPREFLQAFKDFDGNPVDVSIQGDVDEFYNSLMEKLETFLKKNNDTHVIDDVFAGQLSNELICQANHKSERFEHYTSIGLNIKNKTSLQEALQGYVQGQVLQGDNAYYCEGCKQKVKTVKRICLKTLPNVLIVVLKRFQFNYDTMRKHKVNDYCSFPFDLNMKKYTSQYLNNTPSSHPQDYYEFKLRGVIVHYGTSEAGHYYSYIKDSSEWFEFNDEMVTSFNPASIESECFGGTEMFGQDLEYKTEKCKNAYMLFYERGSCFDTAQKPTKMMLEYPMSSPQQLQLHNMVTVDNSSYEFMSIVYDLNFLNFISQLLVLTPASGKLGILVFHSIVLKHRYKEDFIIPIGEKIQEILRKDKDVSVWYIHQFNRHIIREYLLEASTSTKYAITGLLCTAIDTVDSVEKKQIMMFMSFLENKGMTPFARVFTYLSSKEENRKIMQELLYAERVLDIMRNEVPVIKPEVAQDWEVELFESPLPEKAGDKPIKYISLIESLQNFEVEVEILESILPHMTSTASINTIARIAARNCRGVEGCQKALKVAEVSIIKGDEKEIKQYLPWIREIALQNTQSHPEILSLAITLYLNCFQPFYKTYIPFDLLLRGLFKFSETIPGFGEELQIQLKKHEGALKLIETWISKCGNAYHLIATEDWTNYKKKFSGKVDALNPSQYRERKEELERGWRKIKGEKKQPEKEEASAKGKVPAEKPQQSTGPFITTCEQFLEGEKEKYILYPKISNQRLKCKIEGKVGFLYQVTIEKGLAKSYWFVGDNDELTFQNYL